MCDSCDKLFGTVRIEIRELIENCKKMETKHLALENKMERVLKEIGDMKKEMQDSKQEKIEENPETEVKVREELGDIKEQLGDLRIKWSEVVSGKKTEGSVTVSEPPVTAVQAKMIQENVNEAMDRSRRQNKLVIFGIEESNEIGRTVEKIKDIVTKVGVEVDKVKYLERVGKFVSGKVRVVRVICEDNETRRNLLKGANKMKSEVGFDRIYISPDLTKCQQLQDKKLRDKLKDLRNTYKEAKINNGEIVVFEDGTRKVLFTPQN